MKKLSFLLLFALITLMVIPLTGCESQPKPQEIAAKEFYGALVKDDYKTAWEICTEKSRNEMSALIAQMLKKANYQLDPTSRLFG